MSVREQSTSPAAAVVELEREQPAQATPLLDALLDGWAGGTTPAGELIGRIRANRDRAELAQLLFGRGMSAKSAARQLDVAIARLDDLLSRQVNAILHHPRWQALEASWRGLAFLCQQAGEHTE